MDLVKQMWNENGKLMEGSSDLSGNGKIDTLIFRWNDHLTLFHSENRALPEAIANCEDPNALFNEAFCVGKIGNPWSELRRGWGTYTLLVDKDGDGKFDTPEDYCYRALDANGDGDPEAEYYHLFPGSDWAPYSNKTHVELDGDPRMSHLNFETLTYPNEQAYGPGEEYYMNVQGSGFFTNSYCPHPDLSWETPIAWYDFNRDRCPELVMRVGDTLHNDVIQGGPLKKEYERYSGRISEFELAYELNGNTSPDHRHSLDMQLTFMNYDQPMLDYTGMKDQPKWLKSDGLLSQVHGAMSQTREEASRCYLPYMDGCKIAMERPDWQGVFMIFDEDDDDVRWEEMFSTQEDKVEHQNPGFGHCGDQIGDRTDFDTDFGGKGMLYRGMFDGRIHLYHAEKSVWDVDYLAWFKGSVDHPFDTEGPKPAEGMRYPRVRYIDTDGDGFTDMIRYTTVEFLHEQETEKILKEINLTDFVDDPAELKATLFDPRAEAEISGWKLENWNGQPLTEEDFKDTPVKLYHERMKAYYEGICHQMWADAQVVYQAAKKHGLNLSENKDEVLPQPTREELLQMKELTVPEGYSRHLTAGTLREEYNNGFWLREKAFEDILNNSGLDAFTLKKLYYTGKYEALAAYLDEML